jgi:HPt (histidine-containing phosphotransfer) domain-containing protein
MGVAIFNHLNQPRNCHHYDLHLLVKHGDELQKLSTELQAQRDEMAVMKDNLHVGIFLMDKEYLIQPLYSHALENLLGDTDLQGKSFIDMLAASLDPKEIDPLKNYFTQLFAGAVDNVNPLEQFDYVSMNVAYVKDTGVRHLRTVFSLIDRGQEGCFVLGAIEDATIEKKLRQELAEATSKQHEDMRSLLEVIKMGPQSLRNFIKDTDVEFNRINDLLKDQGLSPQQGITEMARAVLAIKSAANIPGLDSFSQKLHEFEAVISEMQTRKDLSFDDVVSLTFDFDLIMKEREQFSDALERLDSFNLGW